jgi:hypothetical protein
MNNKYIGPRHTFLAIAALFWIFFGLNEITQRLLIEVNGTIISSQTTTGNRPVTTYIILGPAGKTSTYIAGPTDHSLQRRLPKGTNIKKATYELSWEKNGKTINDFPITFYLGACAIGIMLGVWSYKQWLLNRLNKKNA